MTNTPNIDKTIERGRVELKPRLSTATWNRNLPIRGDREIWIDGAHWLDAIMSQHGVHGARHTLQYPGGGEVLENPGAKYEKSVVIDSRKYRQRRASGVTVPDQWTAITDKVLALLEAGKLESPAARQARVSEENQRWRDNRTASLAERDKMLAGVFSLRDRTDLTREQRDGLAYLYKEAFAAPMPFPEGKSHEQ